MRAGAPGIDGGLGMLGEGIVMAKFMHARVAPGPRRSRAAGAHAARRTNGATRVRNPAPAPGAIRLAGHALHVRNPARGLARGRMLRLSLPAGIAETA
jgi:hypothetical protein